MTERTETAATIELPSLGGHGDPCRGCRAPLAADQRYCLNCGLRRATSRLGFKEHLLGSPGEDRRGEAAAAPARPAAASHEWTPVVAFAGAVALGFMLMLGVLIGKGGGGTQVAGPAPVIRVDGAAGGGSEVASAPEKKGKKSKAKSDKGGGANASATDLTSGKKKSVKIDKSALSSLNTGDGADYAKKAAKLPDEISVSGKPPPKDNKAAGDGSDVQEFE